MGVCLMIVCLADSRRTKRSTAAFECDGEYGAVYFNPDGEGGYICDINLGNKSAREVNCAAIESLDDWCDYFTTIGCTRNSHCDLYDDQPGCWGRCGAGGCQYVC